MKTFLTLLILFSFQAKAGDREKLKSMTKPGNRVFITSEDTKVLNLAKKMLKDGCWKLENSPDSADFVLKFSGKSVLDYFVYAEVIEPKANESLYKTPSSNTVMSVSFNTRKRALEKLINKHVRQCVILPFLTAPKARQRTDVILPYCGNNLL